MTATIIIDNLDPQTLKLLTAEAERRGVDVATLAGELLSKHFESPAKKVGDGSQVSSLESLAGTWTDEEAAAFLAATACGSE